MYAFRQKTTMSWEPFQLSWSSSLSVGCRLQAMPAARVVLKLYLISLNEKKILDKLTQSFKLDTFPVRFGCVLYLVFGIFDLCAASRVSNSPCAATLKCVFCMMSLHPQECAGPQYVDFGKLRCATILVDSLLAGLALVEQKPPWTFQPKMCNIFARITIYCTRRCQCRGRIKPSDLETSSFRGATYERHMYSVYTFSYVFSVVVEIA